MRRIFFFATPADVVPLLYRLEATAPLKYTEVANQTSPEFAAYPSVAALPAPGISTHETGSQSRAYLVSARESELNARTFVGTGGERRWVMNNGDNENSVVLTMAGRWKDMLLPGKIDTLHDTDEAQRLMKRFSKALKAGGFVRNELFWLGREAHSMLRAGVRLSTTAEQSPPEYDLKTNGN